MVCSDLSIVSAAFVVPLVASAAVSACLAPLFIHVGHRWNLVDVPNERSSHMVPTPRTGGLAILAGIFVAIVADGRLSDRTIAVIVAAAVALAILALVDDLRPLPTQLRLAAQVAITSALVWLGQAGPLHAALPSVFTSPAGSLAAYALAIVWLVGVVNAYNFMDGINGIASLEAIVCGATLAVLLARAGDVAGTALAVGAVGAAAGFLPWNLVRGAIFMGDVGSTTLGLLLGLLVLRAGAQGSVIAAALPLAPFLLDTSVTIVRRILRGDRSIMTAHRTHFYQLLAERQGHTRVSFVWAGLAACGSLVALIYDRLPFVGRLGALLLLAAAHALLGWVILRARPIRPPVAAPMR
jgi:UDP-N-acetylmuramyl pentapeptide phosphotransferase/UDP-N-acetylglucosamine-1-phosphate transferase